MRRLVLLPPVRRDATVKCKNKKILCFLLVLLFGFTCCISGASAALPESAEKLSLSFNFGFCFRGIGCFLFRFQALAVVHFLSAFCHLSRCLCCSGPIFSSLSRLIRSSRLRFSSSCCCRRLRFSSLSSRLRFSSSSCRRRLRFGSCSCRFRFGSPKQAIVPSIRGSRELR